MKPKTSKKAANLTVVLLMGLLAACGSLPAPSATESPDGYIVSVKITDADQQEAIARKFGGQVLVWHPESGFAQLKVSEPVSGPNAQGLSAQTTNTMLVTPEAAGFAAWAGGFSAWAGGFSAWAGGWSAWAGGNAIPDTPSENDAAFAQIRLQQAHAISRNFGAGVKVAVIDTGVDLNHSGLSGRLAPSSEWKDFVDGDTYPMDVSGGNAYGHGTAVAGIIRQVAPRATILPIRVLSSNGSGSLANVISAVDHAVNKGAHIINISLGSIEDTWPLMQMFEYAKSKGVFIVASAGNAGASTITFPAKYTFWIQADGYLFSVGSVNASDSKSSFSNYGNDLFYWAPGEKIFTFAPGNRVAHASGTSFATPLLAGAIALAYAEFPNTSERWRMKEVLENAGERFPTDVANPLYINGQNQVARGRLDVERLIRKLPAWQEPASYKVGTDFVDNGNFEAGWSSKWSWFSNASVSADKYNAAYRGDFGTVSNSNGGFGQLINGLKPNTTYVLTAWVRVQNPGETAWLGVKNYGGSEKNATVTNTGWMQHRVEFTTGSTNTTAEIYMWKGAGYGPAFADMFTMLNK